MVNSLFSLSLTNGVKQWWWISSLICPQDKIQATNQGFFFSFLRVSLPVCHFPQLFFTLLILTTYSIRPCYFMPGYLPKCFTSVWNALLGMLLLEKSCLSSVDPFLPYVTMYLVYAFKYVLTILNCNDLLHVHLFYYKFLEGYDCILFIFVSLVLRTVPSMQLYSLSI